MTLPATSVRITREDLVERIARAIDATWFDGVHQGIRWDGTIGDVHPFDNKTDQHKHYQELGRQQAEGILAAIHEAGCAVVPREATQRMLDEISTHEEPYASLGDGYTTNAKRWCEMVDVGDLAAADLAREPQKEG